jgi:hypothetical protein
VFFFVSSFFEFLREIILIIRFKLGNKRKDWFIKKNYPFALIDRKMASQAIKPKYEITNQIDGSLSDIMKFIIEFGYLSMLGFVAPLIFLFSYFFNILFMRLLKYKLLYIYQRPVPRNTRSLESFNYFIKFIGTLSILANSVVFGITLMGFDSSEVIQFNQRAGKNLNFVNHYSRDL